jgi:5-hydroxyisourate hydrolase-like protein (transthyretin family)
VTESGKTVAGIDFVLLRHGAVAGRVIDGLTGEPIETRAVVVARPSEGGSPNREAEVTDGRFEMTLPDDRFHLLAQPRSNEYKPAYYPNVPCRESTCTAPRGALVSATAGRTTAGYDITVMPVGARVKGRVVDAMGNPLAGVSILVLRDDDSGTIVERTVTKSNGSYQTPPSLTPGTYRVQARTRSDYETATSPHAIAVSGTEIVRDINFALDRRATISGVVTDGKTGVPLFGARVSFLDASGAEVSSVHTNEEGRYFAPLPTERHTMRVELLGWTMRESKVALGRSEARSADFSLAPACAVSVAPAFVRVPAAASLQTLTVNAPCAVCAFDNSPFLAITRGTCRSPQLTFHVEENSASQERAGAMIFPGLIVPVTQNPK